jgi:peptide/nickel transport system substrate-binding protein
VHNRSQLRSGVRWGTTILVLTAALGQLACQSPPTPESPLPLRVAFGIGPTGQALGMSTVAGMLYGEPLIEHDATGRPQPGLAESWAWADAGRHLTLQIKSGVTFHDGSALTAELVADFLQSVLTEPSELLPLGFQRVTSVKASSAHTVTITLSRPDFFLLTALNELRILHPDDDDIGTGPFRLLRREPALVEAERFDQYHGGVPRSPSVEILQYDSHRSAWAALMRGEVDAAQDITREAVDFMERSSNVAIHSTPQPFYIGVVFNQSHPAFSNVQVRRAVSMALDRTRIVDRAMRGLGFVAHGPVWRDHWAYEQPQEPPPFNPREAAELLDGAGYPIRNGAPGRPASRFAFTCLFYSEDAQYERIALMVQRQLFDIGIDVQLEAATLQQLGERTASGAYDAFLAPATNAGRSLMFTYRFWHAGAPGGALWNTGYSGAGEPFDRLRNSTTDAEVREAVQALSTRFQNDVPAAFLAWTQYTRAISTDIDVGQETPDPFMSIWRWQRTGRGTLTP